jgi:ABC-type phosphate/phosphonate transport system substrate-binding protein
MIDPEKSKWDDLVVVSRKLTTEDKREISEFLKAYREKQARGKKSASMSAPRKSAKSTR